MSLDTRRQWGTMVETWSWSQMDPRLNPTSSFTGCVTPSQHLTSLGLSVN